MQNLYAVKVYLKLILCIQKLIINVRIFWKSVVCISLQTGQFQMVDTESSGNYSFFIHQVETAGADILTFDTSSSCQAFAFGDAAGKFYILIWK